MSRERLATSIDQLVELAQSGHPEQALAEVERELAGTPAHDRAGLHFAKCVAQHVLGDHAASAATAAAGAVVAGAAGRDGWRAALLAMRAQQLLDLGNALPPGVGPIDLADLSASFDEGEVLRDLAEAQIAMSRGVADACERVAAYCTMAETYARFRLYELAVPMYLGTYRDRDADLLAPEAPVVQQLNLAALHLTWASELIRVGLDEDAADHCRRVAAYAVVAGQVAAGDHTDIWAERARLFAGCAAAHGPDPMPAVVAADHSLAALHEVGAEFERALTAPFLALAESRAGRPGDAFRRVEAALAAIGPGTDPRVVAATRHAQLVLLAAGGEAGARAGLAYGQTLSVALWRQRARRLAGAEEVLRYERLRRDHEEVSRSSDVDVLTGASTRRSFEARADQLEARRREQAAPVCVLVVDVDGLKQVNDGHGHLAGDAVLRAVGQALTGCTRDGDMVARFGGDEFVALLSAEAGNGRRVAERMLRAVRALDRPPGVTARPTVSIGVARTGADRSLDATLAAADRAMYVAKRSGGDDVNVAELVPGTA